MHATDAGQLEHFSLGASAATTEPIAEDSGQATTSGHRARRNLEVRCYCLPGLDEPNLARAADVDERLLHRKGGARADKQSTLLQKR